METISVESQRQGEQWEHLQTGDKSRHKRKTVRGTERFLQKAPLFWEPDHLSYTFTIDVIFTGKVPNQQMINVQCILRKSQNALPPRLSDGGGWRKCQWCVSGVVWCGRGRGFNVAACPLQCILYIALMTNRPAVCLRGPHTPLHAYTCICSTLMAAFRLHLKCAVVFTKKTEPRFFIREEKYGFEDLQCPQTNIWPLWVGYIKWPFKSKYR